MGIHKTLAFMGVAFIAISAIFYYTGLIPEPHGWEVVIVLLSYITVLGYPTISGVIQKIRGK